MKMVIKGGDVAGKVKAPSSKSCTHRAMICALLAKGKSTIINPLFSDDTLATIKLCEMLGAETRRGDDLVVIGSEELKTPSDILDCGGSATTLRFFTAISALASGISTLTGNESLMKRPVGELLDALNQLGVKSFSTRGNGLPPVVVFGGGIKGGCVKIRGDISSQFISALLLACPRALNKTTIELTTECQSRPYVEMTMEVLRDFGVEIPASEDLSHFVVPARQDFKPSNYHVEGDFSSAASMLAAGALAGKVSVSGLRLDSKQGDKNIVDILSDMGAAVKEGKGDITVKNGVLRATNIDASNIPDLVPICAAIATQAKGETRIINAGRLRLKESDRLSSITIELRKMGANIKESNDGLIIKGPTKLAGADIDPHNDHRIAMACAVAGLVARGETVISNIECLNKSYPDFLRDMKRIGADLK